MVIVETAVFTKRIQQLLTAEQYRHFQHHLVNYPESGAVIPGGGGLRKVRWMQSGRGKRGGIRVIYYWANTRDRLLMLFAYPKTEQDDLTPEQLRLLKRIIEEEYP